MSDQSVSLTDPATELANLWSELAEIESREKPAALVLARACNAPEDSPILLGVLANLGERIQKLTNFAERVEDPFMTDRLRRNLVFQLKQMSLMFGPGQLVQPWNGFKENFVNEAQILALESVSSIVRRHQPLRRLSPDEREQLMSKIADILEAGDFEDIPAWARAPLRSGFERLQFILEHLDFFGHEVVIDHLLTLQRRTEALETQMTAAPANENPRSPSHSILKVAEVLVLGIHLFIAPHHVSEAYHHYTGYLIAAKPEPVKLLTGPRQSAIAAPQPPRITKRRESK